MELATQARCLCYEATAGIIRARLRAAGPIIGIGRRGTAARARGEPQRGEQPAWAGGVGKTTPRWGREIRYAFAGKMGVLSEVRRLAGEAKRGPGERLTFGKAAGKPERRGASSRDPCPPTWQPLPCYARVRVSDASETCRQPENRVRSRSSCQRVSSRPFERQHHGTTAERASRGSSANLPSETTAMP